MLNKNFQKWLKSQKKQNKIKVKIKKLDNLNNWYFNKNSIFHKSKKFFKIIGIDVKSNLVGKNWDQPIIVQNELGILGIIKDKKRERYLLQAKVEPGNKNKLQLSPTVQATKSNYTRIHGGKKIPFLSFFINKKKDFISQSEQGYRYLFKFNYNSLVEITKSIKIFNNFYWFNKRDLIKLVKIKNILNMDTISVFSSFISKNRKDFPLISMQKINKWIKIKDRIFNLKIKIKPLANLKNWIVKNDSINHKKNKHFSVIGININANKREVKEWDQPIIKGKKMAFAGYLIKEFNKTNHYLCRYNKKPGLKKSTLSCSVNTSDLKNYNSSNDLINFEKKILKNFFLNKKKKFKSIYDNILSDEGGRFFNCEIRYKALQLNNNTKIKIPHNYIWVSQNQMIEMISKKKIDIEARLLFGCININKIK
jgi:dTDP-4-dehydro-6-deoxy-alpha-D-glucopyranose 2,3-dehydratase